MKQKKEIPTGERLYKSFIYLVLSILVPVTMAVFVFLCRDKDGGMPPKKSELPPPAEEEQPQTEE